MCHVAASLIQCYYINQHRRLLNKHFQYVFDVLGPETMSKAFSRPWHRISRQKCRIWMRMCRDMTLFNFLEKLNFQAVIKSAASAASRETKNQGPRSRGAHGRRLGLRTTGLGGSPGSWSLIFGLPGGCASSRLDHGLKVEACPDALVVCDIAMLYFRA